MSIFAAACCYSCVFPVIIFKQSMWLVFHQYDASECFYQHNLLYIGWLHQSQIQTNQHEIICSEMHHVRLWFKDGVSIRFGSDTDNRECLIRLNVWLMCVFACGCVSTLLMVGEKPGKLIALTSQKQPQQMSLAFQDDDVTVEQVLMVERQLNYIRHPITPPPPPHLYLYLF